MKLYEFQGKSIFKSHGIPTPDGVLLLKDELPSNIYPPKIIKSQILSGGRGKAGGIKIWDGNESIDSVLKELRYKELNGETVNTLLVEDLVNIKKELYLSITFKGSKAEPVLIACASGGMEIEEVAKTNPEEIITMQLDKYAGISEYQIRYLAEKLGYFIIDELTSLIHKMFKIFTDYNATLIEINPLAVTPNGLVALDAKVNLDDKAYIKNSIVFEELFREQNQLTDKMDNTCIADQHKDTVTYVPLDGEVGLISDGAGTGMLSLDLINDEGGSVASFCELGGVTNADIMYKALSLTMQKDDMKSVVIVFIGGFNRMDHMAEGIIRYYKQHGFKVPVFVRMCGTNEEEGINMIDAENIPVANFSDLLETVKNAVKASKEA